MKLERDFFLQPTPLVAQQMLGLILSSRDQDGLTAGRIVETEAYLGSDDPAAHSYRGETPRTKVMFGEPGHAYVYFTYGMHTCLNVVTAPKGTGHAVLIRALEPLKGVELMRQRRDQTDVHQLCSGPAKLSQALGITLKDNGRNLLDDQKLSLTLGERENIKIVTTTRIGIKKAADLPLRFYVKDSLFISKK